MAMILEVTKSAYYSSYNAFFAKVVAGKTCRSFYEEVFYGMNFCLGVAEAKEVTEFIRPFTRHVTDFETCDFISSQRPLEAIMHCICIMYSCSKYYSQTLRILGFLKMFSNSVVNQVRMLFKNFVSPEHLLIFFSCIVEFCPGIWMISEFFPDILTLSEFFSPFLRCLPLSEFFPNLMEFS